MRLTTALYSALIWGVSSSFGASAAQIAQQAGYDVVGVAASHYAELVKSFGLANFVDRTAPAVVEDLVALVSFKAMLAAADSAENQVKMG